MKILKELGKCVVVAFGAYNLFTWHFVPFNGAESVGYNLVSLAFIIGAGWIIYSSLSKRKTKI